MVQEIEALQKKELPLFLREDYIYTDKPKEERHYDNDRNPLRAVKEKMELDKKQLQELDSKLDSIEFQIQLTQTENQNLIDNVQADIQRRTLQQDMLRKEREKERQMQEDKKNIIKNQLFSNLSVANITNDIKYQINHKSERGDEIKRKILEQEKRLQSIVSGAKSKLDTLLNECRTGYNLDSNRSRSVNHMRHEYNYINPYLTSDYLTLEEKLKYDRYTSRQKE